MGTLTLTNEDILANIETVIDILCEQGLSFTAYNVTQIVRSTGVFVNHSKVREWFYENPLPANYKAMKVLVGDDRNEALLYTTFNLRFAPDTVIYTELQDVAEAVAIYHEWFEETYHFDIPSEEKDATPESPTEDEPEVVLVIEVPGADPLRFPMTEEGLVRLFGGELCGSSCKCKAEKE